ncbi:MAG: TAXI family TRAP transporter solute-binding subunit, partial [Myxococcales bacterium]
MSDGNLQSRDFWTTAVPAIVLVAVAFAVAFLFVKPAPPRKLTIAIAADEGGAGYYARRYQKILARDGITLEVRQTGGSLTSVKLLADPSSGVDAALVQSGTDSTSSGDRVVSLGALSYVPLWVFYRGDPIDDVNALGGRRVAIGGPESGTRSLSMTLLAANGVDKPPTQLLPLDRDPAIEQLKTGGIDAAFVVSPAESPLIKKLAATPGIRLLGFSRADAYVRRFPFLSKLVLPRGVFDLAGNVPDHDVTLVSPTENLLASTALHPALAYLLLRAATEVHQSAGILDGAGEFP